MVNSDRQQIAFFCLISLNKSKLTDECLIPSVCWSTSLWPIVQSGLSLNL